MADDTMRPGGFAITDRAIRFCNFTSQARLADLGCGLGATIRHLEREHGLTAVGLDQDAACVAKARAKTINSAGGRHGNQPDRLIVGDARQMPFADSSLDGLLFECSFSKMEPPEAVLAECRRVLKSGGYWICSDLYARRKQAAARGDRAMTGRFDTRQMIVERAEANGFEVCLFEDHTPTLQAMVGQLILDGGLESLRENLGTSREGLREIGCGYYLMIAALLGNNKEEGD